MQTLWSDPCCLLGLLMGGVLAVSWPSVVVWGRVRDARARAKDAS